MLNHQTLDKLRAMKLIGMAQAFADQLNQPDIDRLSFKERFGLIVENQWTWKENNRMERYLKNARMKLNACVEDILKGGNITIAGRLDVSESSAYLIPKRFEI